MTNCFRCVSFFGYSQVFLFSALALLLTISCVADAQSSSDKIEVIYPGSESTEGKDQRTIFFIKLLKVILAQSTKSYRVQASALGLTSARQVQMVRTGEIDVVWITTNTEGAEDLMPIEIPLDKGLIGWRLFLINKEDQPLFSAVKSIEDLRKIPLGQVQYWHDTQILLANQFHVVATPAYATTFKMLKRKRFLYFPRSMSEIWNEQENEKNDGIVVEKDLLIQYPITYFYYVRKGNITLANDIKSGFEKIIQNGTYEQLFQEYNRQYIENTDLARRRIFKLDNPYLVEDAYIKYKDFWFQQPPTTQQ
jgi:ABC-type amino acid transport substrate-binding protein